MLGSWLDLGWRSMMLRGVLAVVFGVVAMVYPVSTVGVLAVLWGVWAFVDGVATLALATRPGWGAGRVVLVLMGLLALAAGVVAVSSPGLTAAALTWVLGVWLLARGVLDAVLAVAGQSAASRGGLLLSAAADLLLGLLFVLNPGRSAVSIAVLLGVVALVWGAALVVAALATRRLVRRAEQDAAALGTGAGWS